MECPALPGCDSQGDTVDEALEMIKDAIKGHLEVAADRKKSGLPRRCPVCIISDPSGW